MYSEEAREARAGCRACYRPSARGMAYGLTIEEACQVARAQLGAMGPDWLHASCRQIQQHVCSDCTVFPGQDETRLMLCGTAVCPVPEGTELPAMPGGVNWALLGVIVAGVALAGVVVAREKRGF